MLRSLGLGSTPCIRLVSLVVSYSLISPFLVLAAGNKPKIITTPGGKGLSSPSTAGSKRSGRELANKKRFRDGELLVRFRTGASDLEIDSAIRSVGANRLGSLRGQSRVEKLGLPVDSDLEAVGAVLRDNKAVAFAEPNFLITGDSSTPNDPRFTEQWALNNNGRDVGVTAVWEMTTGSPNTIVAVADSGVDFTHADLIRNKWRNRAEAANSRDDDGDGYTDDLNGWDFVSDSSVIQDEHGHGTAVAGVIAAEGNNAIGIAGMMWRAGLMSLRVLDHSGTGDIGRAVEAIDYAVLHGAQVINISWGTEDGSSALLEAIDRAGSRGALLVCAAGNAGHDFDTSPHFPASFDLPNIVAVAGTDSGGQLASWSNRASNGVVVMAPGTDILTTKRGGDYENFTGTSASAALVTGVAGLLRTLRPWLSAQETKQLIVAGAQSGVGGVVGSGSLGMLNVAGSIGILRTMPPEQGLTNVGSNRTRNGGEHQRNGLSSSPGPVHTSAAARPEPSEASLPNLDTIRRSTPRAPEATAPIPSTKRSPRNPLRPWNGRRVGDAQPKQSQGVFYQRNRSNLIATNFNPYQEAFSSTLFDRRLVSLNGSDLRSIFDSDSRIGLSSFNLPATTHTALPTPLLDDQFVQNFFSWALLRSPTGTEPTYWKDILRRAYATGQGSLVLASRELGKTLFESAEYAARARNNHWYVYDLYKSFLMRDPDAPGWAFWEGEVAAHGRENVRRAFEECPEFVSLIATITPNGSASSAASSLITARVEPVNQAGNGLLARDATWSVSLLSLPGRAGMDLGLSLSYSSMVWTRSGPYIYFDEDNGFPSPGFRLGFPTVQRKVFDAQVGVNAYLLVTSVGRRVELRQVGTSTIYEAGDSSYLQLMENGSSLLVRSTDGTQLTYLEFNNEYRCTQIKDRNGNYLTVSYNGLGQITTITDTLERVISFNYDGNSNLLSITQQWNGQTHTWATFGWGTKTMQSSFSSAAVIGVSNGAVLPVINQVGLDDGSYFTFGYTNSLQASVIRRYSFDQVQRAQATYNYDAPAADCPRLIDSRLSASNWTGINGVPAEVVTQYSVDGDGARVLTAPDGTVHKEYYGTGFQKGLTTLRETWSGGVRRRWTTTAWTQDNTGVSYEVNPRVTETNVYDDGGNRRRTTIEYHPTYVVFGLPWLVSEYAANASTVIRRTYFDYKMEAAYIDRRIIGLLYQERVYDGAGNLYSSTAYGYDWPGELFVDTPVGATRHDRTNYGPGFVTGRGNLQHIIRMDITDPGNSSKWQETKFRLNVTGSMLVARDHDWHETSFAYSDSFSDGNNSRNTFAYPTVVTDANGNSSSIQYNYDFGAKTRVQGPPPAGQPQGLIQTLSYNVARQLERVTTTNNGAYRRFWYGPDYAASLSTVNSATDEAYTNTLFDGLGRPIGVANNYPGSSAGYKAQMTQYNLMGRVKKESNPGEINGSWVPAGDDSAGWKYTEQTYDWNGRPLITTNADTTTKQASYGGCGCAGGEIVTLTDEAGRRQRVTKDVLGRSWKTEVLNWDATTYSATLNTYNVRDQAALIRQFQGAGPSDPNDLSCPTGTCQQTTMTYDGHGRLATKKKPEQLSPTNYTYNRDDTVNVVTDARGATTTFGYNARHLVTSVVYGGGHSAPTVTLGYDAAGNRISMTDGMGSVTYSYDQLSRLTSETRYFSELSQSFTLSYSSYNLANQITSIAEPSQFGSSVGYTYDTAGQLTNVTGSGSGSAPQYATNFQYRAWGAVKHVNYGNSLAVDLTYNNKLKATQYDLKTTGGSRILGLDYQYNNAGQISSSTDLSNSNLNRNYEYDHMGRLTLGDTANGTMNGPYKQTYGYDVWSNLTSRSWRTFGSVPFPPYVVPQTNSASYSYLNNRNTASGWGYDADGRLQASTESGSTFSYVYDAQGRVTSTSQPGKTISQSFDGDGRRAKWIENGAVTYYVRSSLLDGQTVTELNQSGQKLRGHIYGGGREIAKQEGGQVIWDHRDVSGVSMRLANSSGVVTSRIETDPLGTQVDDTQNYNYNGGNNGYSSSPMGFYGNPTLPNMGCRVDGVAADCNWVQRQVNNGAAVQCPAGGCGPRAGINAATGTVQLFPFNANAAAAGIGTLGVGLGFLPSGVNFVGNGFTVAAGQSAIFSGMGTMVDAPAGRTSQFYSLNQIEILVPRPNQAQISSTGSQNPLSASEATTTIRRAVDALLKSERCRKFLDSTLSALNTATGIAPLKNKFSDVFKDLAKRVGFYDGSGVIKGYGVSELNDGRLSIGVDFSKATPTGMRSVGITAIHETIHSAARQGLYSQYDSAKAAFDVGRQMGLIPELVGPPKRGDSEAADKYNSDLLTGAIFAACGRQ